MKDEKREATEIISSGLEYLFKNPLRLSREDSDYFDFLMAALHGKESEATDGAK